MEVRVAEKMSISFRALYNFGMATNCSILYLDPLTVGVIKVDILRSWRGQQEVIERERERERERNGESSRG